MDFTGTWRTRLYPLTCSPLALQMPDTSPMVPVKGDRWTPENLRKWEPTGKQGIVEVCTRNTRFPLNINYGMPSGSLKVKSRKAHNDQVN